MFKRLDTLLHDYWYIDLGGPYKPGVVSAVKVYEGATNNTYTVTVSDGYKDLIGGVFRSLSEAGNEALSLIEYGVGSFSPREDWRERLAVFMGEGADDIANRQILQNTRWTGCVYIQTGRRPQIR